MTMKKLIPETITMAVLTVLLKHMKDCDNVDTEHNDQ